MVGVPPQPVFDTRGERAVCDRSTVGPVSTRCPWRSQIDRSFGKRVTRSVAQGRMVVDDPLHECPGHKRVVALVIGDAGQYITNQRVLRAWRLPLGKRGRERLANASLADGRDHCGLQPLRLVTADIDRPRGEIDPRVR